MNSGTATQATANALAETSAVANGMYETMPDTHAVPPHVGRQDEAGYERPAAITATHTTVMNASYDHTSAATSAAQDVTPSVQAEVSSR